MVEEKAKLGIKETKELITFVQGIVVDLGKHKADDGKIDMGEWLTTAMANAPASIQAFMGIDRIDDEMKELDSAEMQELAVMGVDLAQNVMKIFMPKAAE